MHVALSRHRLANPLLESGVDLVRCGMRNLFITSVPGPRDPMRFSTLGLVCVAARTWGDAAPERGRHSEVTSPLFFGAARNASSRVVILSYLILSDLI